MHVFGRRFDILDNSFSRLASSMCKRTLWVTLAAMTACSSAAEEDVGTGSDRLSSNVPTFDIDVSQTSTSGLSSGAFMAVQFHVAFSSIMKGVGVFAGGPYSCAQGQVSTAVTTCMSSSSTLDPAPFVSLTKSYAAAGSIDPVANLQGQRIFLFGGANDSTVNPAVMDGLRDYYAAVSGTTNLAFERRRPNTGHTMPTTNYGVDCSSTTSPYVGKCSYDGAGKVLEHIYGPLTPPASAASGSFLEIPQGNFIASPSSHSVADTGWAYVPTSCANGEQCRIHVAFHGCQQSTSKVGDAFYKHAGYNEWADTNHFIILYPQTISKQGSNPNGCWDWFGYDSANYAKKSGPQMQMVKAMIDHLAGGASSSDAGTSPPPSPTVDAGVADSGSAPGDDPDTQPACVRATNAAHVAAGRAQSSFGLAYAKGSRQAIGLDNAFVTTSLRRVSKDYYVIGTCY